MAPPTMEENAAPFQAERDALKNAQDALSAVKGTDKAQEALANITLSAKYLEVGGTREELREYVTASFDAATEALQAARELKDLLLESKGTLAVVKNHMVNKAFAEAKSMATSAKTLATEAGSKEMEAACTLAVAQAQGNMGDFGEAVDNCRAARQLFRELQDVKGECDSLHSMSGFLISNQEQEKAMQTAYEALALVRKLNDKKYEAEATLQAAKAHLASMNKEKAAVEAEEGPEAEPEGYAENYAEVVGTAKEAVRKFQAAALKSGVAKALASLADVYLSGEDGARSVITAKKALVIYEELADGPCMWSTHMLLAQGYILTSEASAAMREVNEAKEIAYAMGDNQGADMSEQWREEIKELIWERNERLSKMPNLARIPKIFIEFSM